MKMRTQSKQVGDVVVAVIRSESNPRRVYKIRKTRLGLVCPCLSFRFKTGEIGSAAKRCKHFDQAGL